MSAPQLRSSSVTRFPVRLVVLTLGCLFCGCSRTHTIPAADQTTNPTSPSATPSSHESAQLAAGLQAVENYLDTLGIRHDDTWVTEVEDKLGTEFVQFKGLEPRVQEQNLTEADKLNDILAEVDVQYSYKAARTCDASSAAPHWTQWKAHVPWPNLCFRADKLKDRWDVKTLANTSIYQRRPDPSKLPSLELQP